jgi:PAS domain S-box-containing protein
MSTTLAEDLGNAHLRAILDSLNEGVLTTDENETIVMANPAAMRMFGSDELVGTPLGSLIPVRFREQHHRDLEVFGADGISERQMGHRPDVTALRGNGEEFPIDATISVVDVGGMRLFTAVLRDMTEQRAAEREQWANRAKLDAALASMSDAVYISDQDGRFIEFNDAFVSYYRFASRDQCLKSLEEYAAVIDVFTADGKPAPFEQWVVPRALRGETGMNVQYGLQRKDTGERWFGSYSFAPIRAADGTIVGSVVTARDVTPWRRAQADLQASHAALQRLVAAQDRIQEEERKRIARELHDDLAQMLAMIGIQLRLASRAVGEDPSRLPRLLAEANETAAGAITSTRRIINDLRPRALEELGLLEALRALAVDFTRRCEVACDVGAEDPSGDLPDLHPDLAACLYRVAQESLNNVAKHAQARQAHVTLSVADGEVTLSIGDDGAGIRPADHGRPNSFGLQGMSERVRAVGGQFRIDTAPGDGTTITATVSTGRKA